MKSINVTIYCDEVKNEKLDNKPFGEFEKWDYIGICIVPTKNINTLSIKLNSLRCGANPPKDYNYCNNFCEFHNKNNIKVHYQEYANTLNYGIANRWSDIIVSNNRINYPNLREFYMHILGINLAKLDTSFFKISGSKDNADENIYNRFFRTAIIYPLKKYFNDYDQIIIDNIYHDTGNMDTHKYFKYQPLKYINIKVDNIITGCREITFLQTNNSNCLEVNNTLLQFIDLFLGGTFNLLHHSSKNCNKENIAKNLFPIVNRCLNTPTNKNSRYYNTYSISFFPKTKLDKNASNIEQELLKFDNFYTNREMKLQMFGQISLF